MQLQQLISKFVLLAMLFTVFSTPVNAGPLHQMPMPDNPECHSMSANSCCNKPETIAQHLPSHCHSSAMDAANNSNCCLDNDCHANSLLLAILSNFNAISVPSSAQEFTEPEGKRMYFYEVHLRPPVFV